MQSVLERTTATARDMAVAVARGESSCGPFLEDLAQHLGTDAGLGITTWSRAASGSSTFLDVDVRGGPMPSREQIDAVAEIAHLHPAIGALTLDHARRVSDVVAMRDFWCSEIYARMHAYVGGRYPIAILLRQSPTGVTFLGGHRSGRDFTDDDVLLFEVVQRLAVSALAFRAALDAAAELVRAPYGLLGRDLDPSSYVPTQREAEVLALAAAGWTNVRIARRLGITERTVRKHLSSVYEHSGQRGRAAAAAWWAGRPAPLAQGTPTRPTVLPH